MTRKTNWEEGFAAWITQVSLTKQAFEWGVCDCCLLAADGVLALTGVDIADDFRGKYADKTSAFALVSSVAGGSAVVDAIAYCAKKYALPERSNPLFARRGDLVVVKNNDGDVIAGVVSLNGRDVICMAEEGVITLGISQVVRSWSI